MKAGEFYSVLLNTLKSRRDITIKKYKIKYRSGEYDFLRIASKEIEPKDKIIMIRAGIHGDETAGPLTIASFCNGIIYHIHQAGLKCIIYPLGNPSGFEAGKRYNIDDEESDGNDDFIRYEMEDGSIWGAIEEGAKFKKWHWSSEPKLKIKLPKETKLIHRLLKRDPLSQIPAVIDLHQDYISDFPVGAYHYAFGDLSRYESIVEKIKEIAPILCNTHVGAGERYPVKSDSQGFIIRHDGTLSDLMFRLGVEHSVVVETIGVAPTYIACKVNLIWIFGIVDLVKKEA